MQLTKEQWTRHVKAWRSSGSSAREYCQGRGLKVSGLRYWSSRIRREAAQALDETFEGPRFAKVRTTKTAGPRAGSASPSPLFVHAGEVRVEVPADFDAETLRRILEVLRSSGVGR